ncbi:Transposon Ty3-G Gag-Pol polyprotein [Vitis vinifera]|uniref:Transposon Ty3-G Gag-Pol polyprotein n=1 Tax=Vitis vinifera TaxID=29760 RepID=A0A438DEM5_VITVI|nr:Transposon Ty3-G Gag-Pol polyprotein [Vitis vinifera]
MVSTRFRRHSKRAAKSLRNKKLFSQGCEVGFHLEVLSSQLAAYIGQLQNEIHLTVQKGCEITSQQIGDFATLCKMLPSAWSDWLAMAATSSFQLRIVHRLKHWIVDFLSFEMIFDIDDEIIQHASDEDSSSVSYSSPGDQRVSPARGDAEIVDFGTVDKLMELRIGLDLSTDERDGLARPVKQKLRRLHSRWSLHVKEEIQKQLSVGFLSVVEYPEWLANVVPLPKRDNKVRVCVDFRDLNKASPKDDFSLPHIDMLVNSTAGHLMLSFMNGFFKYSQILMAPEDMEKTSFITEWGTYCYRVMSFGLKNAGATYQIATTTLFHDMMHRDVKFRLRLNPKKCTFGVTSRKLLGYMVSKRGIEANPDKIKAILDMPASRTKKEIRGFLVLVPPTPGCPLLLYLSVSWVACWLSSMIHVKSELFIIEWSIVANHLASLPVSDGRAIDDDFLYEDVATVTSLSGWRMYFDGAANHSGYRTGVLLISPHGDHIPSSVCLAFSDRHPTTNKIVEYEACILGLKTTLELEIRQMEVFGDSNMLLVRRFDDLRYTHLPRAHNQFVDALATLASMIDIHVDATVRPLLIESRSAPAYCCLIDEVEFDDDLPWYHDIYQFLRLAAYLEAVTAKDKRALRQLVTQFMICDKTFIQTVS